MSKNKLSNEQRVQPGNIGYWPQWIVLIVIIVFVAAIRIRLLEVPLERDEGEYAYAGQLILEGVPPYAQVYNMKMPGIYAAYALILAVFGQTHSGIHLGLLVINVATILLIFLLAKELFGPIVALVAASTFALLSVGQQVLGFTANAEHFVILFAVGGILLLVRTVNNPKWLSLLAGAILLGLAFIMKQHGAAFIVFAGLYLLFSELRRQPFIWKKFLATGFLFLVGVLLPFAATCFVLWWMGVFGKFWFWTFTYAQKYVSSTPFPLGMQVLKRQMATIINPAVLIWILAGVGLTALFWNKQAKCHRIFAGGFLLFSFLATCPGLYFREHYFILLLPAVAILAGIGAAAVYDLFGRGRSLLADVVPALLLLVVLLSTVYHQKDFFFDMSPTKVSRVTYTLNPFPESIEIARFIKEHSSENDRIAVIGSEPQIYFYSDRRSATGYIYTYALMENHSYARKMQEEMIGQIESASPKFLIFVNVITSWLVRPESEKMIFTWFEQYQQRYYQLIGIIDIVGMNNTIYYWSEDASGYLPQSMYWLAVFQRVGERKG